MDDDRRSMFFNSSKAPMGTDHAPGECEIKMLLNRHSLIDYIGAVSLKIDFSGSNIDTRLYDKEHNTGKSGILTAKNCVEHLRQTIKNDSIILSKNYNLIMFYPSIA